MFKLMLVLPLVILSSCGQSFAALDYHWIGSDAGLVEVCSKDD